MAVVKSGSRADRDALRAAMLNQGCCVDEIAAEMRARWVLPCGPPTATPTG